ncbi:hypothetical protein Q7P37_005076 [Cladosporium fusiforme]
MPIIWNAETEAKLLAGLFKVCDIKVSGDQLKELAKIIGPDCTPKAITHRISKIRNAAGALNVGDGGDAHVATPKSSKKGAKGAKGSAKKRKAAGSEDEAVDDDDGEEILKKAKVEDEDE